MSSKNESPCQSVKLNLGSRVWSCNEWDPLEEVIIGTAKKARRPTPDVSTQFVLFPDRAIDSMPDTAFSQRDIEETEEDLTEFANVLAASGVTVRRAVPYDTQTQYSTPDWASHGFHAYCPRDVLTVIGDRIIEAPCAMRSRYFETLSYRDILVDYLKSGARWFSAPRPTLRNYTYGDPTLTKRIPNESEPVFDAANVLRLGYDVLYLVSCTGNLLGAQWLQTILGDEYRVHCVENVYHGSHIDTTFVALRPGLVLCNPARVSMRNLPKVFNQWDVVFSPPMVDTERGQGDCWFVGSDWIGMNVFSISPSVVVVDRDQGPLAAVLARLGFEVISLPLRHARKLGGGFHCVTLDIRRQSNEGSRSDDS